MRLASNPAVFRRWLRIAYVDREVGRRRHGILRRCSDSLANASPDVACKGWSLIPVFFLTVFA
jgi:hypothetical protein